MADALTAATRLEAAVTLLAAALERRAATPAEPTREEIAALAARLDAALGRLRVALREPEPTDGEA